VRAMDSANARGSRADRARIARVLLGV